ncbi:glycoside hydrolase domain-containing protein [Micromonospora sp. NPDC049051]|uniref:glycoside hydrolase domain-containing protein n=1 Tax=Micromonospora sp. NPDC049051 TaxID=3364264 RepID=UPI00371F2D5F
MTDEMVLRAQQWVNATYGGVPGYNRCTENGRTGWQTIYSLTRALQHELGITALSDSFGPTTLARLTAYGTVGQNSGNMNMRTIAEAALYCKGYSGGQINGAFGLDTQSGLAAMVRNMGLPVPQLPLMLNGVEPKVFKALLSMDAYVLVNNGSAAIQECQRWLNGAYIGRGQYFIGPCDGHFSRNVQQALVLAIQYQLGMTDSQVTGYIGPGTRSGLQNSALVQSGSQDSGPTGWVRLFQCAMAFNRYGNRWGEGGGVFNDELARIVSVFQRFCMLPETGKGDYQTWMSLLVSTGDPERRGTAIDCMYPLNSTTIQTVKNAGYKYAGRYLTGGTNKVLTHSEIALIFDNGLSIFPLYQEWGDAVQYFDYTQGFTAGTAACAAARGFGIPYGTVIYFSVDFDALDEEITSAVIPHFKGVRDAVAADGNRFAIGVYGCRNTCLRLEAEGLTTRSFVSGMSTGYSGNLGYPLPGNWAFDQISNFVLGAGTPGALEIDNNIVSGRDLGVDSVTRPRDPNDGFYTMLIWLEARAKQWREDHGHTARSAPELVAQFLRMRSNQYAFTGSNTVFGELDSGFIDFVRGYPGRPDDRPLRDPKHLWDLDIDHFGASFGAILNHNLVSDLTEVNLADFGSWGGDVLSVLGQWTTSGLPASQAYAFAMERIATRADNSFLTLSDLFADVDALVLGHQSRANPQVPLSTLFQNWYATPAAAEARFANFYARRFKSSASIADAACNRMFGLIVDTSTGPIRDAFWVEQFSDNYLHPTLVPEEARKGTARAFVDVVKNYAGVS